MGEGPLWTSSWATVREQSAGLAQGLLPEDGALPRTQTLPQLRTHVAVSWPSDLLLAGDPGPSVGPLLHFPQASEDVLGTCLVCRTSLSPKAQNSPQRVTLGCLDCPPTSWASYLHETRGEWHSRHFAGGGLRRSIRPLRHHQ